MAQLKLALRLWESKYPQDGEDPDTTDEELAKKLHQVYHYELTSISVITHMCEIKNICWRFFSCTKYIR